MMLVMLSVYFFNTFSMCWIMSNGFERSSAVNLISSLLSDFALDRKQIIRPIHSTTALEQK